MIRADLPNAPIEVLPGKCVCEIKQAGFDKASGVHELMSHEPFRGHFPIFIGDDVTDESVFAAMPGLGGLAFSVGRRRKASRVILTSRAMSAPGLRALLMAKLRRRDDRVNELFLRRIARERILAAEMRIPDAASPEFGFNSLEK